MVTRGTRESSNTRLDADTFRPLVESDCGDRSLNDSPVGQGARGCLVNESITRNRVRGKGRMEEKGKEKERKKGGRSAREGERDGLLETLNVVWRAPVAGSTRANASLACTLLLFLVPLPPLCATLVSSLVGCRMLFYHVAPFVRTRIVSFAFHRFAILFAAVDPREAISFHAWKLFQFSFIVP